MKRTFDSIISAWHVRGRALVPVGMAIQPLLLEVRCKCWLFFCPFLHEESSQSTKFGWCCGKMANFNILENFFSIFLAVFVFVFFYIAEYMHVAHNNQFSSWELFSKCFTDSLITVRNQNFRLQYLVGMLLNSFLQTIKNELKVLSGFMHGECEGENMQFFCSIHSADQRKRKLVPINFIS